MENKIFITTSADKNRRLDNFLQEQIPDFTRSKIAGLIEKGLVKIGGKIATKNGEKLKENQTIEVEIPAPVSLDAKPENLPLEIVFEDDDLAVVNKPQGMVVHAGSGNTDKTLVNALLFHIKNLSGINGVLRPGIVHRLDKNTAGLLVVAKNDFAHTRLAAQLANKTCRREYIAIVEGDVKTDEGTIQTHIARSPKNRKIMAVCDESAGKVAITNFLVLQRFQNHTLMQFNLQTGRTHQIRVHCKDVLHCPIAGDIEYGGHTPKVLKKTDPKSLGQYLVARKLEFLHPRTNKLMTFEINPPEYFEVLKNRLSQ